MGKKRLLCGMMVLMLLWWTTAAHALTSKDAEHPNNPDPGTCSVFAIAGVLTNPSLSFILVLQNYLTGPRTFTVRAFIVGGTARTITRTIVEDGILFLNPIDIPVLNTEVADIYVCWTAGTITQLVPPGALLLLLFQGNLVVEPPAVSFFLP